MKLLGSTITLTDQEADQLRELLFDSKGTYHTYIIYAFRIAQGFEFTFDEFKNAIAFYDLATEHLK